MRICAAWPLKDATTTTTLAQFSGKPPVFMSGRCSLTQILRSLGHAFLARTLFLLQP